MGHKATSRLVEEALAEGDGAAAGVVRLREVLWGRVGIGAS
jgi:hypothetical protein